MKLTREQRDQLQAGGAPRLKFPGEQPCPLEPGDVLPVASNLSIVIDRIRRSRKGEHVATYTIRDFRIQLVRRVPPMYEPPELDDQGYPIPHDKEAIKRARMEGAVTSSRALAVADAGEFVPGEYQNVVNVQARAKQAQRKRDEQPEREAQEDLRRLDSELRELVTRAVKMGIDPVAVLAPIAREVTNQHASLRDAA